MLLEFEWDDAKSHGNRRKHGISFEEAVSVFADRRAVTIFDEVHSDTEDRYHTIGTSRRLRLLLVVHVERRDRIRIISARRANIEERTIYEQHT